MIFIQHGPLSVDSFFFLSGFLATFSLYRVIQKLGNRPALYIPMSYLTRFLRIAPMMMFVTAIQWTLADQLPYGYNVRNRSRNYEACDGEWYKILFFYANLTLAGTQREAAKCMSHLWYIQCDMQMFLLLPVLLWIFTKNKVCGLVSALVPVTICIVIRLYYGFYYEFIANIIVPPYPPKHGGNQNNDSYVQPWTRMSVYFIAVALAFAMILIDESRKQKFVLKAWQYWSCILMAAFIMLSLVVWPYQDAANLTDDRWSKMSNSLYFALSRPAWGVGLALMTFAFKYMDENTESNGKGQRSMVKFFLSLEIWQPLGKLTYVMYLVHWMVFEWWVYDIELPTYYDEWYELLLAIGIWFIVAFIGLVLWLVVEQPMANLVTQLLKSLVGGGGKKKKPKTAETDTQIIASDILSTPSTPGSIGDSGNSLRSSSLYRMESLSMERSGSLRSRAMSVADVYGKEISLWLHMVGDVHLASKNVKFDVENAGKKSAISEEEGTDRTVPDTEMGPIGTRC